MKADGDHFVELAAHELGADRLGLTVKFRARVVPPDFDTLVASAISKVERSESEDPQPLTFDFSDTSFMDVPSLQCLIEATRRFGLLGHDVTIRVPKTKAVRDVWKAWGLIEAMSEATGLSLSELVHRNDHYWFDEEQTRFKGAELVAGPGYPAGHMRFANFFGLHTEVLNGAGESARLAYDEKGRWTSKQIQDVLKRVLPDAAASSYIPSRVVFEIMLNAMRHPGAKIVQTASFFDRQNRAAPNFTIHFWDDGEAMSAKLLAAIKGGSNVRCAYEADFNRKYLVHYSEDDRSGASYRRIESSLRELDKDTSAEVALLATLFPGVTTDPDGIGQFAPEEVTKPDERLGRPGMGLFVLANTVVEMLHGSVSFRTGKYFLNVRPLNSDERKEYGVQPHVAVRIRKRSEALPDFVGNLVTVRLRAKHQ